MADLALIAVSKAVRCLGRSSLSADVLLQGKQTGEVVGMVGSGGSPWHTDCGYSSARLVFWSVVGVVLSTPVVSNCG